MKTRIKIGLVPSYRAPSYRERVGTRAWCVGMRKRCLDALAEVLGMEVVVPQPSPDGSAVIDSLRGYVPDGLVGSLPQGEAAAEYFAREKVDGIIICTLDFGDERSAARIAERLQVPVLLVATREPPALDDASLARLSDSYCGTLPVAAALHRRKIPFHFGGIFFPEEPGFTAQIETFVRAVAVVKALRGARIGQIGVRPETFEAVTYDEAALIQKYGQIIVHRELSDILLQAQAYDDDDPAVQAIIANTRGSIAEITVADDWLLKAAKLEVALMNFWRDSELSAMAIQCWPTIQATWSMCVCAVLSRLTQRHMLSACEADVLGALAMLSSYGAGLGENLPHFVDWTIQHRENPNRLLAWHCGNAPVSLANDPGRTALRSRLDMRGVLPVRPGDPMAGLYQFQLRPGPVTLCRLAEYDGDWKMLIATGEIVPSDDLLAGTWSWVEVGDHARLYRTLVEEGFAHHASLAHGHQREPLKEACKFLDIKPIVID